MFSTVNLILLMNYFQLEDDSVRMRNDLKKILYELRIEATVAVIEMVGSYELVTENYRMALDLRIVLRLQNSNVHIQCLLLADDNAQF